LQLVTSAVLDVHHETDEPLYAQQSVLDVSSAQSAFALQRRTVKVSGFAALPQLRAGRFSVQLVWQLDVIVDAHDPTTPPSTTSVPQHTVPAPHSLVPVLPVQSSGRAGAAHEASQAPGAV
jgi:hypothetical protein